MVPHVLGTRQLRQLPGSRWTSIPLARVLRATSIASKGLGTSLRGEAGVPGVQGVRWLYMAGWW